MKNRTAIISNKKLATATSFEGEECLIIRRVITRINNNDTQRSKFMIQTNACNYYDVDVPVIDENGNVVLGDNLQPVTQIENKLKTLHQIGQVSVREFSFLELDNLAVVFADIIPDDLTQTEKDNLQEQLALLHFTQSDPLNNGVPAYGTEASDWELLNI